ncbi:hypothetical protein CARUB_v10003817mg [Capsella rubella]|uniref:NAC domain-containing protein n=1 Tax=Capsella rubella TaxID=81985 RepID=R0FKT7_9BRAS|nr:NAC transcription factor 29 [Capsella rubella]EOA23047.1 hypothetical protein CARUB_v10003817mg [Capsella rubella]
MINLEPRGQCYSNPDDRTYHYPQPFDVPIHHVNIYKSDPQQLSVEYEKANDEAWFFITERYKKGISGKKHKLADDNATVGAKKIERYRARKPHGVKTDWLMHEYSYESPHDDDNDKVEYVLCKIYLTPSAVKRMKDNEKEKVKKGKGKLKEKVKQLEQPQCCLPSAQDQEPKSLPYNIDDDDLKDFDEFFDFVDSEPQLEDVEEFFAEFMKPNSVVGDEEDVPKDSDILEGFFNDGMMKDLH